MLLREKLHAAGRRMDTLQQFVERWLAVHWNNNLSIQYELFRLQGLQRRH